MSKLIYNANKAYDTKFELADLAPATFEVTEQLHKDGSKKGPNGKLIAIPDATATTPNLRVFCTLRIAGVRDNFMQELSKMNGAGFDTCVDETAAKAGELVVKTGAKVSCYNGVVSYSM